MFHGRKNPAGALSRVIAGMSCRHTPRINSQDLRAIEEQQLFPMSELPSEWQTGDDGSPRRTGVAALHRSRSGR